MKSTAKKQESPFWKPETEGETLKGIFQTWQPTTGSIGLALALTNGKLVGMSYQLHEYFKDPKVRKLLIPEKTELTFVYLGKQGRMRSYSVAIGKSILPVPTGFEAAKPEDVEKFFTTSAAEISEQVSEEIRKGKKRK